MRAVIHKLGSTVPQGTAKVSEVLQRVSRECEMLPSFVQLIVPLLIVFSHEIMCIIACIHSSMGPRFRKYVEWDCQVH